MFFPVFVFVCLYVFSQAETNLNITSSLTNDCVVKHGRSLLREGETIVIHRKIYKVEDCQLQRAYNKCGPKLWLMLNIACKVLTNEQEKTGLKHLVRRFTQEKLLSDICCLNACTVTEMTKFCL